MTFPRIALFLVVLLGAAVCRAAPDAGAKARGEFNFYSHGAHAGLSSARSHTETYQRYLRDTHGIAVPAHAERIDTLPRTAVMVERPVDAPVVAGPATVDRDGPQAPAPVVAPAIAREASDVIADDIERVQRHVTRMLATVDALGDETVGEDLHGVEKQLAIARRAHAALHAHHASETISPSEAMALAQRVNDALRSAHAVQDRIVRRIGAAEDDGR